MKQDHNAWPMVPLGSLAREVRTKAKGKEHLPVLSMSKHRGFVPSLDYFSKQVFSRQVENYKVVRQGQFAYATIHLDEGSIGVLEDLEAGLISPMYTVFEIDNKRVDAQYLLALLKQPAMIQKFGALGQGTVNRRKSVVFKQLAQITIPLPGLKKQRYIAEILQDVELCRDEATGFLNQLQALKRGAMHDLLTKGVPGRHAAFQETALGLLPEGWEVRKIESLGRVQAGRQRSPHHITGQLRPYLRVANVFDGYININDVLEMQFTDKEFAEYRLQYGDILLNEGQSLELVGRPAMYMGIPANCCFQNTLVRFRAGHDIIPDFALQLFRHFLYSGRFMSIAKKTTSIAHLGVSRFGALQVALPPLAEQQVIIDILAAFDERIRVEQERLRQLEQVKAALAQQLLTGRLLLPELQAVTP